MTDWWKEMLDARREEGSKDADKGIYQLPYQYDAADDQDDAENEKCFDIYQTGDRSTAINWITH